jgi:hypothetical protein
VLFSGTPVSSTKKTDEYDIAKILLTVTFNTITIALMYFLTIFTNGSAVHVLIELMIINLLLEEHRNRSGLFRKSMSN